MILVTGGTGLVGSHLLFELSKTNEQIRATIRKTSNIATVQNLFNAYSPEGNTLFQRIQWVDTDIESYDSLCDILKGVEEVYHCAAMVSFDPRQSRRMLEVNVLGTAKLVDASIHCGVKRFCQVSSVAALGSAPDGEMVNEETPWGKSKGKSGYAISKFFSEMEVWRGQEEGLNVVVVNPSVIIGPCRWNTSSGLIFGTIAKGFPFYTLGTTGYVDVRDVVASMLTAMQMEKWGSKYLLNGENLSHKHVFDIIAQSMGKKPPYIYVKPWMTNIAWKLIGLLSLITKKSPSITRDTARSAHSKTYYSSAKATDELGINFRSVSEAIANTTRVGSI